MANGIVLNIDTTKSEFQNPMVQLRQGDGNYQSLDVTVTSNGELLDLTGWTVTFMGTTASGFKIVDASSIATNALQGEFTYTPTKAWGQDQGEFKNAYFKFTKADETASGASFRVNVLEAVDLTAEEAGNYISIVDALIDDVKTSMDNKLAETKQTLADTQSQSNTVQKNVNDLNTNVNDLKAQNNAIKTADNTWTGKNTFDLPIVGNIHGTATTANDPQAVHINDFGVINNFKQPDGTTFVEKVSNEYTQRDVNVKWYGAKGDGVTDNTQAFNAAITAAKSIGTGVYVPGGNFFLSKSLDLDMISLRGESRLTSILNFADGLSYGVSINSYVTLQKIRFVTHSVTTHFAAIRTGRIFNDASGQPRTQDAIFSLVDEIFIDNVEGNSNITGILYESFASTAVNQHVLGVDVSNVFMLHPNNGIVFDSHSNGWLNGNNISNVTIRGLHSFGVKLDSSKPLPGGIYHNSFNNIQVEYRDTTPTTARALGVFAGEWNEFHNFTHFNDAGVFIHSIQYGVSVGVPTDKDITRNDIFSGTVEGQIAGATNSFKLNSINLSIIDSYALKLKNQTEGYRTHYNLKPVNYLGSNIFTEYFNDSKQVPFTSTRSNGSDEMIGVDNLGAYSGMVLTKADTFRAYYSVFKDALAKLKSSGLMTLGALFSYDGDIDDLSFILYANVFLGSSATLVGPYKYTFEKYGNGLYAVTVIIDATSAIKNPIDFINITAALNGDGVFKLYGLKATSGYVRAYGDMVDVHQITNRWIPTNTATPTTFRDLGIFMPPAKNSVFDTNLATIKNAGNSHYVDYPVMF